ncbi:unnamed protein product, partial [Ilex paraguariensis]
FGIASIPCFKNRAKHVSIYSKMRFNHSNRYGVNFKLPKSDQASRRLVGCHRPFNGLGKEYDSFIVMMENRQPSPTFVELRSRLFNHEQHLKCSSRSMQTTPSMGDTTLVTTYTAHWHQNSPRSWT